jgi:hypothetical protein
VTAADQASRIGSSVAEPVSSDIADRFSDDFWIVFFPVFALVVKQALWK